ncbi:MliC family protein [Pseudomonas resinovorans]|uniref:MliC family protein n=1 Tax=Metapseudomonas resinovorans TaxID=53412 RepID=A0ABT4YD81_METRE|nr:MliC family protein [Pseudomonas resinovorans]MDA8486572.1 MliC family protein [Pseudomonas resinovorans]
MIPAKGLILALSATSPLTMADAGPSFDCTKAQGVEQQVCASAELSALDRQMADVYKDTLAATDAATQKRLRAEQRGWLKGRDDCWKATDQNRCLTLSYQTRLVELQIRSGAVATPKSVAFACGDASKAFTAAFYNDTEPGAAFFTYGGDHALAISQRTASGARYSNDGVDFWEHQGEAKVEWYGTQMTCKPVR